MTQVWKFRLQMDDHIALDMPKDARLLSVQAQREEPQLWALCDPTAPKERRFFRIAGTGHPIEEDPERLVHVGSFQLLEGALIFHVFEIRPKH